MGGGLTRKGKEGRGRGRGQERDESIRRTMEGVTDNGEVGASEWGKEEGRLKRYL